ncbi:MAG: hypothetical protein HYS27_12615 [Deltaproteobacteria bacterium]|nr:hypothetical protein [Deltaproteobacteria bacterium]
MRCRLRATIAVLLAVALHATVQLVVGAAALRVRQVPPEPPREAVELTLVATPPPLTAPTPPRAPAEAAPIAQQKTPALPPAVDEPRMAAAPPLAAAPPEVASAPAAPPPARPRSLLERVLAGASPGPLPSADVLDPSLRARPATDAERARRSIQALAAAAAARGAPVVDAGSLIEQLEPLEGGGYRYTTGGFVATIHVDGSVTFVDKDHREGLFSSGLPGRDPDNLLEPYGPAIEPRQRIDGAPMPRAMGTPIADNSTTLGSGSFDPTAALLRAQGQDPYQGEKTCFLDETAPLRADLRETWERAQLAGLRLHLERLWFDDSRPAVERRAALFAAWDECREEAVGLLARQLIESFVRQHLPKGGAHAYGAEELAALNVRRASSASFAPYG